MKGTVLHFDPATNEGVITTDSGRFKFVLAEWKSSLPPKIGSTADFLVGSENMATEIYAEQRNESLSTKFQEIIKSEKVQGVLNVEQGASLKDLLLEVVNPKTSILSKGAALGSFIFKKSKSENQTKNIESPLSFKDE